MTAIIIYCFGVVFDVDTTITMLIVLRFLMVLTYLRSIARCVCCCGVAPLLVRHRKRPADGHRTSIQPRERQALCNKNYDEWRSGHYGPSLYERHKNSERRSFHDIIGCLRASCCDADGHIFPRWRCSWILASTPITCSATWMLGMQVRQQQAHEKTEALHGLNSSCDRKIFIGVVDTTNDFKRNIVHRTQHAYTHYS